jgi:hypothetical protein
MTQVWPPLENLIKTQKSMHNRDFVSGCQTNNRVFALFHCPNESNYITYIKDEKFIEINVVAYNTERSPSTDSFLMEKFKKYLKKIQPTTKKIGSLSEKTTTR